ncbi:MAG: hypothetical protein IPH03_11305 [Tetrasphaera sp.]|jgi:hypothetical protein|nr:hypothetical protein [Tetrasphaera sp.]
MSEQREIISDDLTAYSLDDEDQLQPEDTLIDDGVEDVLDRGFSPADTDRGSRLHGVTAHEQGHHESIDERLAQEEPDPYSRLGLDDAALGGDDPDAIAAEDDWLDDHEVGDRRAGRLTDTGEESVEHTWGRDVGVDGAGASAEEAAMHIIEDL